MGTRARRVQGRGADPAVATAAPARRLPLLLAVALLVVAIDQLTKWWAVETLSTRTIDVVWTLRLHLILNHAAAFSLGGGLGPILPIIALVAVALLLRVGSTTASFGGAVALGFVLGGALGNLTDRAFRAGDGFFGGGVVDFIDFQWWPVFNVADMAIFVGGALVLLAGLHDGDGT